MGKKIIYVAVGLMLTVGCTTMLEQRASVIKAPEIAPGAAYLGSVACADCHEGYGGGTHMQIASFEAYGYQHGCEGCHGPGSLHVQGEGDTSKILRYGPTGLQPDEVSGVCTTCHQAGGQMHWSTSEHAMNDVACTSCHKVHKNNNKALLAQKEVDLCVSCHNEQKAKLVAGSHHPVKEGQMSCSSCHSAHGSSPGVPSMLKTEERVNDLCLDCHSRYQGPFVFEHAPVAESCLECHDPHGTVANNLLRQNEPFLCLQCHEGHFHAAREGLVGLIETYKPGSPIVGTEDAYNNDENHAVEGFAKDDWAKGMLTKCTTCHQSIHGSDLPSQAGNLHGQGLTR